MSDLFDLVGTVQRSATWRWELLDQALENPSAIEVARDEPPTLSVDTSRSFKRTLTGVVLPPSTLADVNVMQDRLRLTMVLQDGSEWPQGTFLFSDASRVALSSGLYEGTVSLVDQLLIVDQKTDRTVTVRPGVRITDAINSIVASFALPVTIDVTPSGQVITPEQEAVNWPAGTSLLRIINELAAMLGYHELYFDRFGIGLLGPMPNPEDADASTLLSYPPGRRTYLGSEVRSSDGLDLPNRFVVIGGGTTDAAIVGRYTVPSSAPHSKPKRGFYVTEVEQLQGIETAFEAYAAARALARSGRYAHETVEWSGPPDARHDTYNIVDYEGVRILETSWSLTVIEGADMQHAGRRTYEDTGELE